MQKKVDVSVSEKQPVIVKKYANRRLYNTETSAYVTLEDLAQMVRSERDFVVYDAKTGDDLTRAVLTQIIVEQESRPGTDTMLPIPFLRQLIRYYGDQMQCMVPSYLEMSLANFNREQERLREQFAAVFTPQGAIELYQEQARKNIAMFEQAMSMFTAFNADASKQNPFPGFIAGVAGTANGEAGTPSTPAKPEASSTASELAELKAQLSAMQQRIEKLARS